MATTTRDEAALRHHYETERALADRLRAAPPDQRAAVYGEVYDELFRSVPDHPQLSISADERRQKVEEKLHLVGRFLAPDTVLVELGPGDCAFSVAVSSRVRRVYAVDVSEVIVQSAQPVPNVEVRLSDGVSIPVETGVADIVYSDQLMEHLHPDDAAAQLREVRRVLHAGGRYVCVTPSRLSGPHDVSRAFDDVARGFHLREYDQRTLRRMFRAVGFSRVRFYVGGRGRYLPAPYPLLAAAEWVFDVLPKGVRRRLRATMPVMALFGVNAVATA
jgi:SAM-dependent methyltransferase